MKYLLSILCLLSFLIGAIETYIDEYTYQASEYDSRVTAQAYALERVQSKVLQRINVFIKSETKFKQVETNKGIKEIFEKNITSITAGVLSTKTIEERWDGKQFYIKVEIKVNTDEIYEKMNDLIYNKEKLKEYQDKTKELLELVNNKNQEIQQLKKELENPTSDYEQSELSKAYIKAKEESRSFNSLYKGNIEYSSNNYSNAIESYLESLEFDDNNSFTYNNLGLSYYRLGYNQKAEEYYLKALKLDMSNPRYYFNLGLIYLGLSYENGFLTLRIKNQNFDKAELYFNSAIDKNKSYDEIVADSYWGLGKLYESIGNIKLAAKKYNESALLGNEDSKKWLEKNLNVGKRYDYLLDDYKNDYYIAFGTILNGYFERSTIIDADNAVKTNNTYYLTIENRLGYSNWGLGAEIMSYIDTKKNYPLGKFRYNTIYATWYKKLKKWNNTIYIRFGLSYLDADTNWLTSEFYEGEVYKEDTSSMLGIGNRWYINDNLLWEISSTIYRTDYKRSVTDYYYTGFSRIGLVYIFKRN